MYNLSLVPSCTCTTSHNMTDLTNNPTQIKSNITKMRQWGLHFHHTFTPSASPLFISSFQILPPHTSLLREERGDGLRWRGSSVFPFLPSPTPPQGDGLHTHTHRISGQAGSDGRERGSFLFLHQSSHLMYAIPSSFTSPQIKVIFIHTVLPFAGGGWSLQHFPLKIVGDRGTHGAGMVCGFCLHFFSRRR